MRYRWLSAISFIVAVLLADDFATPMPLESWDDMQTKHSWNAVPDNWESIGHPPAGTTINLYISVKPERESALMDALSEVSNPSHPRYGAYLSAEQVAEHVMPHPDTRQLINAWLKYHGIRPSSVSTTHGGAWLTVTDVLVSQANQLLGASYHLYRNSNTNDTIIRTVGYALPAMLHKHIQTVAPTTYFTSKRVAQQEPRRLSIGEVPSQPHSGSRNLSTALASRANEVWPEYLYWLYDTEEYVLSATEQNRLAVLGLQDQYPSQQDLTRFMEYSSAAAMITPVQVNNGPNNPHYPSKQANTDIQYAAAMAFATQIIFYSTGGDLADDSFLQWFAHILHPERPNIPQTISISYGDYEPNLPDEYAWSVCLLFMHLGSQGVSVVVASGSEGVGPRDCLHTDGNIKFVPEFPSSWQVHMAHQTAIFAGPWVTSVGGTTGDPEVAAGLSGGGFSTLFPRPGYQFDAVGDFFQNYGHIHAGLYNSFGRGYPDIAAQALNFEVVFNNEVTRVHGTPCAVATVAGIISLINDFRISQGRPTLGFLNPWLYSRPNGLHDITSGSNPGCDTTGFTAVRGWDPVTGLGTLRFQALLSNLPPDSYRGAPPVT